MVPFIPPELVIPIVEEMYHLPDGTADIHTLSACSLVCQSWRVHSQRLLLSRATMRICGPPDDGQRSLTLHQCLSTGSLGSYIRALDLSITTRRGSLGSFVPQATSALSPDEFVSAVEFCPHLYHLSLNINAMHSFDADAVERLSSLSLTIRALDVSFGSVTSPVVYQLLAIWPSIQSLRLRTEMIAPLPSVRPDFSLYELSLHRSVRRGVLEWLIPPPDAPYPSHRTPLRILDFWDTPNEDSRDIIFAHATNVRSLRLTYPPPAGFMDSFNGIQEFVLRTTPDLLPLRPLPSSIEHLHFHNFSSPSFAHSLVHTTSCIRSLPNVTLVTVNKPIAEREDFGNLVRVCEDRGIEIRVDPKFYYLVKIDQSVFVFYSHTDQC